MSEKEHDFGSLVCVYAQLLPKIREAAKALGYAIAIHGSEAGESLTATISAATD